MLEKQQLDDQDGDTFGNRCDSCSTQANSNLLANSNTIAESRPPAVAALGDRCDPVPVYVPHAVPTSVDVSTPPASRAPVTLFHNYAAIGSNSSAGIPGEASVSFAANVAHRRCDCIDGSTFPATVLDQASCVDLGLCPTGANRFDEPSWKRVTLQTDGVTYKELPTPTPPGTSDPDLTRVFTDETNCDFPFPKGPSDSTKETCYVGKGETLRWHTALDIAAGRVSSVTNDRGEPQTSGLWWSRVRVGSGGSSAFASDRDASRSGRLRDAFEFVETPLYVLRFPPFPSVEGPMGSKPFLRIDLGSLFKPVFVPEDPIRQVIKVSRLVPAGDTIVALSDVGLGVNVTAGLSPALRAQIVDSNRVWLSPVESGPRATLPGRFTQFVSLPSQWKASESHVDEVLRGPTGLHLAFEQGIDGQVALAAAALPTAVGAPTLAATTVTAAAGGPTLPSPPAGTAPSDRSSFAAALSGVERAVYLVGGSVGGKPTGGIWRYFLDTASWSRVFVDRSEDDLSVPDVARPENVRAVAYDSGRSKLVVVDTMDAPTTGKSKKLKSVGRVLVYDTATGSSRVALKVTHTGVFVRLFLASDDRVQIQSG